MQRCAVCRCWRSCLHEDRLVAVLVGKRREGRRDLLARATPHGREVHHHQLVACVLMQLVPLALCQLANAATNSEQGAPCAGCGAVPSRRRAQLRCQRAASEQARQEGEPHYLPRGFRSTTQSFRAACSALLDNHLGANEEHAAVLTPPKLRNIGGRRAGRQNSPQISGSSPRQRGLRA